MPPSPARTTTDRRRRQAQGIQRAKTEGRYRGRPEDEDRNAAITKMLKSGQSWSRIVDATDLPLNCHPAAIRASAVSVTL